MVLTATRRKGPGTPPVGRLPPPAEGQRGHRCRQQAGSQHVGGFLRRESADPTGGGGDRGILLLSKLWPTPRGTGQRNLAQRQDKDTSRTGE